MDTDKEIVLGKFRRTSTIGVLTLVLLVLAAGSVAADMNFDGYTWEGAARKDPVNFLFVQNGSLNNTLNEISAHYGWWDALGLNQQFIDHGVREDTEAQKASSGLDRDHQRYNQGNGDGGIGWGTWTMAPIHREKWTSCTHVSTSFNDPRNEMRNVFSNAGHSWGSFWKGNNQAIQQCDGSFVAGDGTIYYIVI